MWVAASCDTWLQAMASELLRKLLEQVLVLTLTLTLSLSLAYPNPKPKPKPKPNPNPNSSRTSTCEPAASSAGPRATGTSCGRRRGWHCASSQVALDPWELHAHGHGHVQVHVHVHVGSRVRWYEHLYPLNTCSHEHVPIGQQAAPTRHPNPNPNPNPVT